MADNPKNGNGEFPSWFTHKTIMAVLAIAVSVAGWANLTVIQQGKDIAVLQEQIKALADSLKQTNETIERDRQDIRNFENSQLLKYQKMVDDLLQRQRH